MSLNTIQLFQSLTIMSDNLAKVDSDHNINLRDAAPQPLPFFSKSDSIEDDRVEEQTSKSDNSQITLTVPESAAFNLSSESSLTSTSDTIDNSNSNNNEQTTIFSTSPTLSSQHIELKLTHSTSSEMNYDYDDVNNMAARTDFASVAGQTKTESIIPPPPNDMPTFCNNVPKLHIPHPPSDLPVYFTPAISYRNRANRNLEYLDILPFAEHDTPLFDSTDDITPLSKFAEGITPLPMQQCLVCLEDKSESGILTMPCCNQPMCLGCIHDHVKVQFSEGKAIIKCPNCAENISESLVFSTLDKLNIDKKKFIYILTSNKNLDDVKSCPFCCHIIQKDLKTVKKMKRAANKKKSIAYNILCDNCSQRFCFYCQSPPHPNVSCNSFQQGDGLFNNWMKQKSMNQFNAHRCPKCKIPIQRCSGCPNMTCSKCNTNFCYNCGSTKKTGFLFGGHSTTWSIFGCNPRQYGNSIALTRLVRWSIFSGEISLFTLAALLLVPVILALWPGILLFGIPTLVIGFIYFVIVK